jgi:hypothetical protein
MVGQYLRANALESVLDPKLYNEWRLVHAKVRHSKPMHYNNSMTSVVHPAMYTWHTRTPSGVWSAPSRMVGSHTGHSPGEQCTLALPCCSMLFRLFAGRRTDGVMDVVGKASTRPLLAAACN